MSSINKPEAQATWLTAAALGGLDGVVLLELPFVGLLLALAAIALLARYHRGVLGVGGLATGVGALELVLLWRGKTGCDAFDAVPGQGCSSPGIDGFLLVAGVIVLVGLVLTGVGLRSDRRS